MKDTVSSLLLNDQFDEAINICLKRFDEEDEDLLGQLQLGLAFLLSGREAEAQEVMFEILLQQDDEVITDKAEIIKNFLQTEIIRRLEQQKLDQAKVIIYCLLEVDNENSWAYQQIGNIHFEEGDIEESINDYRTALSIDPSNAHVLLSLGFALKSVKLFSEAEECLKDVNSRGIYLKESFYGLSEIYKEKKDFLKSNFYYALFLAINHEYELASKRLEEILASGFEEERLYLTLFECYRRSGKNDESVKVIEKALEVYPYNQIVNIKNKLNLPLIYDNEEEINFYRQRFSQGLEQIISETHLSTTDDKTFILDAISRHNNFYLAYQGHDDLVLQCNYGSFIHEIIKANFSDLGRKINIHKEQKSRKIKVGYISSFFREHTVCKLFKGWIKFANKDKFEIFSYYLGENFDEYTKDIEINSDHFYHFSSGFETICQKIIDDNLDILVYPEIGMDFRTLNFASLKLAPIQCMAWGHPVTSGLPTIDYFLSSNLMEPENSESHYREELVKLSNIGISYEKPLIPTQTLTRKDFGIRQDAVVYLSCQSIFKYLPQYDYIFATIAKQVPSAQLVFIAGNGKSLAETFRQRLNKVFIEYGLIFDDYCIIVPAQDTLGYFSLNLASDIFLDSIGWSGGNTTLEALGCNLPVVTYPGKFMRGRHSYAMLKQIEVTETIADSMSDYIMIATQLGLNQDLRHRIRDKISSSKSLLFDEKSSIADLEKFYQEVVFKKVKNKE